jgi:hypothetical protein
LRDLPLFIALTFACGAPTSPTIVVARLGCTDVVAPLDASQAEIDDRVTEALAQLYGVETHDDEVDRIVEVARAETGLSIDAFWESVQSQGLDREQYRRQIRLGSLRLKIVLAIEGTLVGGTRERDAEILTAARERAEALDIEVVGGRCEIAWPRVEPDEIVLSGNHGLNEDLLRRVLRVHGPFQTNLAGRLSDAETLATLLYGDRGYVEVQVRTARVDRRWVLEITEGTRYRVGEIRLLEHGTSQAIDGAEALLDGLVFDDDGHYSRSRALASVDTLEARITEARGVPVEIAASPRFEGELVHLDLLVRAR